MSGYTRTDTTNNIADGNVISAADLDNEFNGVQAAFNSSTGHTHDGSSAEGAPITKLGPVQDVTISTTVLGVKTTNTVDLGTSSLKFKDFYLAGNALIGGTLGVTGATTLSAALTYGGVTLSNAVTGTGNMVLSASPTLTGTITAAAANFSGAVAFNGTTTIGDADTDTITQAASYVTGTQLKSAKTATNTLSLAAYDVDGTTYTNLITLTASNTPTLTLTSTGVGTINNMSIGATTASTGAFTTLTSNGATTFTAGTASTTTGTGTLVITGGLGVSGRINAANFDGIVGANTAAAGSFTTLSATDVIKQTGNPSLATAGATEAFVAHNTGYGAVLYGQGTTYDVALLDRNTTPRLTVTTTAVAVTGTFSSTLGATIQGLTVGLGAGAVATNTVVGNAALSGSNTGDVNTAIGYQALKVNTSGQWNIGVGAYALTANQSGVNNTAVGRALVTNVSGADNTAVGMNALYYNTGSNNTAVGSNALINTTGGNNTAVGYQAGLTNTTGIANVYSGRQAGYTGNGNYNTFVGDQAGYTFNTDRGTFVGAYAGQLSTGIANTFIGQDAGAIMVAGIKNTIVGRYNGNAGGLDIRNADYKVVVSDGDGYLAFHNDSSQWTTNPFGSIDITNNSATANVLAITANTATGLFSASNAFSGVFIINDISQTGACCICIFGGGSLQIISQSGASNYFVNSSSPGSQQIGIYSNGNVATLKPNPSSGGTTNFRIIAFRTRTAT